MPVSPPSRVAGGHRPEVWWRHALVPVLGAAITVAVIVEASGTAQVVGAIWLAVGLAVLVVQGRRNTGDTETG